MKIVFAGIDEGVANFINLDPSLDQHFFPEDVAKACLLLTSLPEILIVGYQYSDVETEQLLDATQRQSPDTIIYRLDDSLVNTASSVAKIKKQQGINHCSVESLSRVALDIRIRQLKAQYRLKKNDRNDGDRIQRLNPTEQEFVTEIYHNLVKKSVLNHPCVHYNLAKSATYNGIFILGDESPCGHLVFLIVDFSDCGLRACVGLPVMTECLYTLVSERHTLPEIVQHINVKLGQILPKGSFCHACCIEYRPQQRSMSIWNGGLPDPVIIRQADASIERPMGRRSLPLGIVNPQDFRCEVNTLPFNPGDMLYIYTADIFKMISQYGDNLTERALTEIFQQSILAKTSFSYVKNELMHYFSKVKPLPATLFGLTSSVLDADVHTELARLPIQHYDWQLVLDLHAQSLMTFDPLPILLQIINESPCLVPHKSVLYTILSELYSNALDHGILKLDSKMKFCPNGFVRYYKLRETKLKAIQHGTIRFEFSNGVNEHGGCFRLIVEDSGDGFDHSQQMQSALGKKGYSGRGIPLLRTLCQSLSYNAKGNRVEACFFWQT